MERAQRAADSPMRAILEAAKVRRRIEPDAAPEADAAPRRGVAAGAGAKVVATAAAANAAPAPQAHESDGGVVAIRTLPARLPAAPVRVGSAIEGEAVAPLARSAAPAAVAEVPRLAALAPAEGAPPRLVRMVQPEVSPRWIEGLASPEVRVEFDIRPDGSVTDVQMLQPVPRPLVRAIVAALEQWQFEPVAALRRHRVQLVFKAGS
jgi:TonB family protein